MKKSLPILIIVAVLGAALLTAWSLKRSGTAPTRSGPTGPARPTREGAAKLGADPPHALGQTNAPAMLEEFADFQCGACASLQPVLKTVKSEFGQDVVLVFRHFPIVASHANAMTAARVAEVAGLQGKFWQMHDLLYQQQKEWAESSNPMPQFEQYANQIGLDMNQFRADLASKVVDQRIAQDRERAYWIGVNGTPTVFLNGQEIPFDQLTIEKLRPLIRAAAQK